MESKRLDRDKIDFGNGRIGKVFRSLFFPTLIGMIFNSALTVIDGIFVGHGVGSTGIAAVNIVAPCSLWLRNRTHVRHRGISCGKHTVV